MAGQRLAFGPAIRRSEAVNQHDQNSNLPRRAPTSLTLDHPR
jgi:hypothetical protein